MNRAINIRNKGYINFVDHMALMKSLLPLHSMPSPH
jgi:hypothetical protein